jgi:hypothetical protein
MIIFLDIDGVLVNRKVITERNKFYAPAVTALNQFCAIPDCRVVVSSAWRVNRSVEELSELFKANGVGLEVVGKTPSTAYDGKRGAEILAWLKDNKYTGPYIVIDDEIFDIAPFISSHKIIHVRGGLAEEGLTKEHIDIYLENLRELNGATVIVDPWWQIKPFINYVDQMARQKPNQERRSKMCSQSTMHAIETVIGELTAMRRSFTGRDVYERIHNKHVRRDEDFSGCTEGPGEVSKDVRRLFNGSHTLFSSYGSTIVPHDNGPVMYFPLPYHAKVKVSKILSNLS